MPAAIFWILQNLREYGLNQPDKPLQPYLVAFACSVPLVWVLLAVPCCQRFSSKSEVRKFALTFRIWALTGTLYSIHFISSTTRLRCHELFKNLLERRLHWQKKLILETYRQAPIQNSYVDNLNRAILMRASLRAYRQLEDEAEVLLISNELHAVLPEFPNILRRLERYVQESSGALVQAMKELKKGHELDKAIGGA